MACRGPAALRQLFFDGLGDELTQGNSQRAGGGLGLAVRDLQGGLHAASVPCLWDNGSPRKAYQGAQETDGDLNRSWTIPRAWVLPAKPA